ncbi:DUF4231 domain-containing protein [Streptomyces flaveolus]|uniref:DUF4231 domain-containing protein n=1 Tax=Streptomyces flaveolus TaxID=67297 RepID=UPI00332A2B5B
MPYAPWVFAILRELRAGEPSFAYDDAFKPMSDGLSDWGMVDDFLDAAAAAQVEWLDPWFVHPYRRKPTGALIRCSHADGSESLWTGVQIEDHLPPSLNPTWGEAISWTLTSVTSLGREIATIRRSPRGPANSVDDDSDEKDVVRREGSDMRPGGNRLEEEVELEPCEPVPDDESEPDLGSGHHYSEWVYEIVKQLEYDGRQLAAEDASSPFPDSLNWSYVRDFLDAAYGADIDWLSSWFVYPDYRDLRNAVVWCNEYNRSGALWTYVSIDRLVSNGSNPDSPSTWGAVVESSLEGLTSLSEEPDLEYVTGGKGSVGGGERIYSEDAVRALIDEAVQAAYDRERESSPDTRRQNELGHPFSVLSKSHNSNYVEFLIAYRRSVASLASQLHRARMARSFVVGAVLAAFLIALGGAVSNAITWGRFDMLPYNLAGGMVLALLCVVFVVGRRMNVGNSEGEGDSPKSVAALQLEIDLLEERRVLEASAAVRSARDRQYSYRETIPQEIERLRRETRRYRRVHNFFQWSLFVASVTMSVTAAIYDPPQPGKVILIGLGAFVSFTTAVTGYFKYRERAFNLQQTADAIEQHVTAFDLAIAPYNQADETINLERLAENVETLRVEQRKREQQLEQPHQGQQEVV